MSVREWNQMIWDAWVENEVFCHGCPNRDENHEYHPEWGGGNQTADLMFVAETPYAERETKNGEPSDVPSCWEEVGYWDEIVEGGWPVTEQFLKPVLRHTNQNLHSIYYTNVKKCPDIKGDSSANREAMSRCTPYLLKEIDFVDPELIVPIGQPALDAVTWLLEGEHLTTLKDNALRNLDRDPTVIPSYHWGGAKYRNENTPKHYNVDSWHEYVKVLGRTIAICL